MSANFFVNMQKNLKVWRFLLRPWQEVDFFMIFEKHRIFKTKMPQYLQPGGEIPQPEGTFTIVFDVADYESAIKTRINDVHCS